MSVIRLIGGRTAVAAACLLLTGGTALAQLESASPEPATQFIVPAASVSFDIPAQSLNTALIEFGRQSGQELLYDVQTAEGRTSSGVTGDMSRAEAMTLLLNGTGLEFEVTTSGGMVIDAREALEARRAARESSALPLGATDAAPVGVESVTSARRGGIEEIIVTARRREESVQTIPISITALSSEDMKTFGIRNVADMEGIVPGLNMGGGGNGVKKDSNPFIRGVGQRETKVTLDPAVGTYIDGIYLARTSGALLDSVGVERIEVLRGPQGTLFGRNVTGGAISITTKKPTNDWSGQIGTNVGNYGRSDFTASVNVPIVNDTLLSRLTVSSVNSEGYFTNVVDNAKWGDDNRVTGIGQLRWLPTDTLTFDLLGERTRIRETPRPMKCVVGREINTNSATYFYPFNVSQTDYYRTLGGNPLGKMTFAEACAQSQSLPNDQFASDFAKGSNEDDDILEQGRYWVDTQTWGLTGTWDSGDLGPLHNTQFKSISAWRRVESIADEDLDAVAAPYLLRLQPDFTETTQFSQELQFTGNALDDRLFFSTGLYYFQEKTPKDDLYRAAGIGMSFNSFNSQYAGTAFEPTWERLETDNKAYAWFGQLDFNITPQLQATAGLRYTHEERWSRYSKAYATYTSMTLGPRATFPGSDRYGLHGCLFQCSLNSLEPGLARMQDWEFTPLGYDELSTTDAAWTPMASLKYQFSDEALGGTSVDSAMAYFTYSEGFHSGGVTAGAVDSELPAGSAPVNCEEMIEGRRVLVRCDPGQGVDDPITFKPEHVKNYEVGLKMQAFERRMQMNLAVFYMDYTDMQITSTANRAGIPIPQVENVGKSVIQGVEAEFVFMPTPEWRVVFSGAWTDADMKEWEARKILLSSLSGAVTGETTERRDDEPMPRVPEWQGFLLTDYSFRLPGGSILAPSIAARYTSEIYHGFDRGSFLYAEDVVTSDKVTFIDVRIPWISADGKMEVAAWVKNLTNIDDYLVGGIPLVDVTGAMGQVYANPRTFGLNLSYTFGAM